VASINSGAAAVTGVCAAPLSLTSTSTDPDGSTGLTYAWKLSGNGFTGLALGTASSLAIQGFYGMTMVSSGSSKFNQSPYFSKFTTSKTYTVRCHGQLAP
jgi:hypothetical protein